MKIKKGWRIEDKVSGLRIVTDEGKGLNGIHIEFIGKPKYDNRDFFFKKDGSFDGTSVEVNKEENAKPSLLSSL